VQAASSTNAVAIYMTTGWMLKHGLLEEAWDWVQGCPLETRSQQPAPMAVADCLMARKDWSTLESYLAAEEWGELDFLRLGLFARALAEQKRGMASEAMWRGAVRASGNRLGPLTALLEMAISEGRSKDAEDLLWQIADRFPREKWALRELDRAYLLSGNTRGLNKLYSARVKYEPTNYVAKNNLAATSLLLKQDLANAHALAKAVHSTHPEDPVAVATYAFSLHLQGRTREGLELLDKAGPEALERPAVALYYGVLLAASGDAPRAGKYFEKVKGSFLLPEERAMLGAGPGN
jgi:Flp pilus assembly protein TadD